MILLWFVVAILASVAVLFSFVLLFGAPYLPTLKPQIDEALRLVDLKPGQTLLELGSGDGRVLLAAAEQDVHVIGYELNPVLVLISLWRTRHFRKQVKIIWGNFWWSTFPKTDVIFVFLLQKYMTKLDNKITQDFKTPVKLVSFAFFIPNKKPQRKKGGLFLYLYP